MTPSPQPRPQVYSQEQQDSRISEEKSDMNGEDPQKEASEDSSGGSGSGMGYNADYSSSESSLSSKQKNELQRRVGKLKIDASTNGSSISSDSKNETAAGESAAARGRGKKNRANGRGKEKQSTNDSTTSLERTNRALHDFAMLPQWNGVSITHPMDPRIDLSTVGYTVTSIPAVASLPVAQENENAHQSNTFDHYLHLMEVRLLL